MPLDLFTFKITDAGGQDANEKEAKFVNSLNSGEFTCNNGNIYDVLWNIFGQMYNIRKNKTKKKRHFFGWLFKTSSFMNAYKQAEKEETTKSKVNKMLIYKYDKNSIMRELKYEEILNKLATKQENLETKENENGRNLAKEVYGIDLEDEEYSTDILPVVNCLNFASVANWGNDNNARLKNIRNCVFTSRLKNVSETWEKITLAAIFWMINVISISKEEIANEITYITNVKRKKVPINDKLATNANGQMHTRETYQAYLYKKYYKQIENNFPIEELVEALKKQDADKIENIKEKCKQPIQDAIKKYNICYSKI